ncbi:MAG: hypothetical protein NC200_04425 [Candidatus Gastranaerophilales bacterium]|nr:hypothetical protein [Candidatus Gastranaerophilales bacterium]
MKKRMLCSLLMLSIMVCFCSCGSANSATKSQEQVENHYFVDGKELSEEEYNKYLESKEQEQIEQHSATEITESTETHDKDVNYMQSEEAGENSTDNNEIYNIFCDTTFSASDSENDLEITVNSVDFEQEVHSLVEDTNMYSQYFPDKEEETYIVMRLNIKNNGGEQISYKIFDGYNSELREYNKITVIFDNKYNYNMQQLDTQSIVMGSNWHIQPLKEQEVYFVQSVPDEVVSMPFTITFKVGNSNTVYTYTSD